MKKILLIALTGASLVACTSKEVVSTTDFERNVAADAARKYFIVQNIATERTRVYEKCQEKPETKACINGTRNRLVFETEMVVGGDDLRTDLGVQNISHWEKFYQDNNAHYPSWYDPSYPPTPKGGFLKWSKKSAMPNKQGQMRGAFGWYAAIMSPSATGQWMHGTIGWGDDKDSFIKIAHGKGIGFFGKLFLLTAGAGSPKASYLFITLAALNMIVSLYYYLRVVRAIFMEKNEQPIEKVQVTISAKLGLMICAAGIVLTGILSWIYDYIQSLN